MCCLQYLDTSSKSESTLELHRVSTVLTQEEKRYSAKSKSLGNTVLESFKTYPLSQLKLSKVDIYLGLRVEHFGNSKELYYHFDEK